MTTTLEGANLGLAACTLSAEVAETEPFALEARAFFISWQGVPTLAYRGFPPPLTALKARLSSALPSLPSENPGSRWPKTTLGCLREGQRLGKAELAALQAVCARHSEAFGGVRGLGRAEGAEVAPAGPVEHPFALTPDAVRLVVFAQRSLEKTVASVPLPLKGSEGGHAKAPAPAGARRYASPAPAERARLEAVLAEADESNYWFHASKDGNRETHYRGSAFGATVAVQVAEAAPRAGGDDGVIPLLDAIEAFRKDVDETLPGHYVWFDDASLHVTVRGICG